MDYRRCFMGWLLADNRWRRRLLNDDDVRLQWEPIRRAGIIRQEPIEIAEPVREKRGTAIESSAADDDTTGDWALPGSARSGAASTGTTPALGAGATDKER